MPRNCCWDRGRWGYGPFVRCPDCGTIVAILQHKKEPIIDEEGRVTFRAHLTSRPGGAECPQRGPVHAEPATVEEHDDQVWDAMLAHSRASHRRAKERA